MHSVVLLGRLSPYRLDKHSGMMIFNLNEFSKRSSVNSISIVINSWRQLYDNCN